MDIKIDPDSFFSSKIIDLPNDTGFNASFKIDFLEKCNSIGRHAGIIINSLSSEGGASRLKEADRGYAIDWIDRDGGFRFYESGKEESNCKIVK